MANQKYNNIYIIFKLVLSQYIVAFIFELHFLLAKYLKTIGLVDRALTARTNGLGQPAPRCVDVWTSCAQVLTFTRGGPCESLVCPIQLLNVLSSWQTRHGQHRAPCLAAPRCANDVRSCTHHQGSRLAIDSIIIVLIVIRVMTMRTLRGLDSIA